MNSPSTSIEGATPRCAVASCRGRGQSASWSSFPRWTAELLDEPRDPIATLPAARRAFDAQHVEAADQAAYGSVEGHLSFAQAGERPRWAAVSAAGHALSLPHARLKIESRQGATMAARVATAMAEKLRPPQAISAPTLRWLP
jgi:hypothetical protein